MPVFASLKACVCVCGGEAYYVLRVWKTLGDFWRLLTLPPLIDVERMSGRGPSMLPVRDDPDVLQIRSACPELGIIRTLSHAFVGSAATWCFTEVKQVLWEGHRPGKGISEV